MIAATHTDLQRAADEGRFRLDLFYRLRVGTIELPPLRDRVKDLPLLSEYFLQRAESPIPLEISEDRGGVA